MTDIFLSYSQKDKERVRPLVVHFERLGWSIFWDRNIPPGKSFYDHIEEQLEAARCVVVVWSEHSVVSDWVLAEAEEGKSRKILVPLRIDQVDPPFGFGSIKAADLTASNSNALQCNSSTELCQCLKNLIFLFDKS